MMNNLSKLDWVALILTVIGGLNWGIVAYNPEWNLVAMIAFGYDTIVYYLVGLSALYIAFCLPRFAKK